MEQVCRTCQVSKDLGEFAVRSDRGTPATRCKACTADYQRAWHARNRERRVARAAANAQRVRQDSRARLLEYLASHPCVDCGWSDPLGLDFDHVRGTKRAEVTVLASQGCAWRTVVAEIAKCEVRCVNCHQRRTAWIGGHWKTRFAGRTPADAGTAGGPALPVAAAG